MTSLQPSSARHTAPSRLLALQTLLAVERQHCFADDAFATFAARANLSHEDQALAFELVYGGTPPPGDAGLAIERSWRVVPFTGCRQSWLLFSVSAPIKCGIWIESRFPPP